MCAWVTHRPANHDPMQSVEHSKDGKHAAGVHEKHIPARVKHHNVQNTLSGQVLRHMLQKQAWLYRRMNCESGSISDMRKYASGECSVILFAFSRSQNMLRSP